MVGLDEEIFSEGTYLALSGRRWDTFKDKMAKAGSALKKGAVTVGKGTKKAVKKVRHKGESECHVKNEFYDDIVNQDGKNRWNALKDDCEAVNTPFQTCTRDSCPACDPDDEHCTRKYLHSEAQIACAKVEATVGGEPNTSICEWRRG